MKISKKTLGAFATVAGGVLTAMPAMAATPQGTAETYTKNTSTTGLSTKQIPDLVNTIINVALGIIGLLAVIMIIVGGFQYTTSSGDSAKVTKAKNTIMYGVIGLVIALLAYAIVNFVLTKLF